MFTNLFATQQAQAPIYIPSEIASKIAEALNDCSHMSPEFVDLYKVLESSMKPEDAALMLYTKIRIYESSGLPITKMELDKQLEDMQK